MSCWKCWAVFHQLFSFAENKKYSVEVTLIFLITSHQILCSTHAVIWASKARNHRIDRGENTSAEVEKMGGKKLWD